MFASFVFLPAAAAPFASVICIFHLPRTRFSLFLLITSFAKAEASIIIRLLFQRKLKSAIKRGQKEGKE
jgi:hypothetical protein